MNKKFAFTLAEVMIAVSIIGILTAATVPSVMYNYQKKTQTLLLKKTYVNLTDNLDRYKSEQGINAVPYMDEGKIKKFIEDNYNNYKYCANTTSCFSSNYKSLSGTTKSFSVSNGYGAVLKDDVAIYIKPATIPDGWAYSRTCVGSNCYMKYDAYSNKKIATVYVDVNGTKPPNIGGRDMFTFNIYGDYSIDVVSPSTIKAGTAATNRTTLYSNNCLSSPFGTGCLGKILNDNWEMNY